MLPKQSKLVLYSYHGHLSFIPIADTNNINPVGKINCELYITLGLSVCSNYKSALRGHDTILVGQHLSPSVFALFHG